MQSALKVQSMKPLVNKGSTGLKANKWLKWAGKALQFDRSQSIDDSCSDNSEGTELLPPSNLQSAFCSDGGLLDQKIISNIDDVGESFDRSYQLPQVSRNLECVEFYCPKIGLAEVEDCQRKDIPGGFWTLDSILRPWQVEFLNSVGVERPEQFVELHTADEHKLARSLRRWRRKRNMSSIKTKSCSIALHIWSRSCKAAMRSYQKQMEQGVEQLKRPDFLDVSSCSASTLGLGSSIMDANSTLGLGSSIMDPDSLFDGTKDILFVDENWGASFYVG